MRLGDYCLGGAESLNNEISAPMRERAILIIAIAFGVVLPIGVMLMLLMG